MDSPRNPDPQRPANANPLSKLALFTALAFVFLYVSRIMDLTFDSLHLPLVFSLLAITIVTIYGSWMNALRTRAAVLCGAITIWMLLGLPFSAWRGGSLGVFMQSWLRAMLIMMVTLSVCMAFREVVYLMNTLAAASLTVAAIALQQGSMKAEGGRLTVEGSGVLNNPNDLAFLLLLGVPLWMRYLLAERGILRKGISLVALGATLSAFFRTGSRGGFLMLLTMILVAFFRAPLAGKAKVALVSILVLGLAFSVMPGSLADRFFSYDRAGSDATAPGPAGSIEERRINLIDSLRMTLHYPIFGVGPGNFVVVQDRENRAAVGRRGSWLGTHNTYTQLSSECGVPVLILFLLLMGGSLRSLAATRERTNARTDPLAGEIRKAALAGEVLLWGVGVFIFFAHIGYYIVLYLIVALAQSITRAAERDLPGPSWGVPAAQPAYSMIGSPAAKGTSLGFRTRRLRFRTDSRDSIWRADGKIRKR